MNRVNAFLCFRVPHLLRVEFMIMNKVNGHLCFKTTLPSLRISINVTEKEMDAIEDVFFCELSEKDYKKIRPILIGFWEKLCNEMDKDK